MKGFLLIAVAMLMLIPTFGLAAEQGTAAWTAPAETQAPLVPVADAVTADDGKTYSPQARRMSFRERRTLGLTRRNIIKTAFELHKAGELDVEDTDLMMNQIMAKIVSDNPGAYASPGERDWDSFFAFLEKLIPLLLELFAMFGMMS